MPESGAADHPIRGHEVGKCTRYPAPAGRDFEPYDREHRPRDNQGPPRCGAAAKCRQCAVTQAAQVGRDLDRDPSRWPGVQAREVAGAGAKYYRWAEKAAIKWGQEVIADAQAIADYVKKTYGRDCVVIPYGAEVINPPSTRLGELQLSAQDYHLIVARFEPENHLLEAVHAYRASNETRQLVVVGSAPYSQWYVDKVRAGARGDVRIRFTGAIYDQELLDQLYGNAIAYIHGHSVGGTNPSLLRAMGAGAPVLAYDVEFNREVTANQGYFWGDVDQLKEIFNDIAAGKSTDRLAELRGLSQRRIQSAYQWDSVTDQYEALINSLVNHGVK